MKRVRVRATAAVLSYLDPGEEAEVEATPMVYDLLKAGYLVMLKRKDGPNVS